MNQSVRQPGGRLSRVAAGGVIVAAAAVFLALLALNLDNLDFYDDTLGDALYFFGVPALLAAAILSALRLPSSWRVAVAISLAAIVPTLYAVELWLTLAQESNLARIATEHGASLDTRNKIDVILDLRARGTMAFPTVRAKELLVEGPDGALVSPIQDDGRPLLPLATMPDSTIVACNETGRWLTYRSDRHGFRNPPGAWSGRPAVALVGDSFAHGDCVGDDANLGALLRARLGSAVNLGVAGNGPLSMLATVKEYLPSLAPPVVLWFFFEGNDISKDLPVERRSAVLTSYLKPDFSQGLAGRSDEIARRLGAYLDGAMAEAMARIDDPEEVLLDYLKLYRLREAFGLDPVGLGIVNDLDDDDFALFAAALAEAKRVVAGWGGQLLFVYLPDSTRYLSGPRHGVIREHIRSRTLAAVASVGLPVIDVHRVFAAEREPMAMFRYPGSHYNERGYRTAANAVARALDDLRAGSTAR